MAKFLTILLLRLREATTLDVRSLALFRVAVGSVLLGDLVQRAQDLTAMYTDAGLLPASLWAELRETPWAWSLHLFAGTPALSMLIFGVHAVLAVGIIVGWRSRWCCLFAWLLLVSLHHRNPLLVTGGNVLLGMFLFWATLLPLDRKWALRPSAASTSTRDRRHCSVASVGLVLQIVLMYFISGVTKLNEPWLRGEALDIALNYDMLVRPWGIYLRQFPQLTRALTYGTLGLELLGPWLLLTTAWRYRLRWIAWWSFVGFHVGIAITMDVKLYSYVCLAGLLIFVPTSAWKALGVKLRGEQVADGMTAKVNQVCRWARVSLASVGIGLMLLYNGSYVVGDATPGWLENVASVITWNQRWSMFAVPMRANERHVMFAELDNGEVVDVLRAGAAIPKGTFKSLSAKLPSPLWTRLCLYLNFAANNRFREAAARYRMQTWNDTHSVQQQIRFLEYRIVDVNAADDQQPAGAVLFSMQIDPRAEGRTVDGVPEGAWVFRHANGNISSEGTFVAGVKQGRWRSYYPDGSPESDGLFLNDQPHGAWRYWDESGQVLHARYAYGRPIEADATDLTPP